jgi:hypothetical protein
MKKLLVLISLIMGNLMATNAKNAIQISVKEVPENVSVSIRRAYSSNAIALKASTQCSIPAGSKFFIDMVYNDSAKGISAGQSRCYTLEEQTKILHILPMYTIFIDQTNNEVKQTIQLDAEVQQYKAMHSDEDADGQCTIL